MIGARVRTAPGAPRTRAGLGLRLIAGAVIAIAGLAPALPSRAQVGMESIPEPETLVKVRPDPVTIAAGSSGEVVIHLEVAHGWHINANPPSPDYMIATTVTLAGRGGIAPGAAAYPGPKMLQVAFETEPLLVYDGTVTVRVPVRVAASATGGAQALQGSLRFQACNDQVCLAPATVSFEAPVTVTGGTPGGAAPDTAGAAPEPAPALSDTLGTFGGGAPAAGAGSPALDNPIARKLAEGGWTSFLALFLIGLALNLTPCVYPMLGVTVSIFGARRAAPPLQVFGLAVLYVLGMAVMYSSLGLIAALTGGLFGGFLQNPIVLVGIGLLLGTMALAMFGAYEFEMPVWLRERLGGGGNTSAGALGVFVSGLIVGVFAAPCVGPPVVALLAVIGAKGDPWFGFSSFFVLALGLGAPYLVLGTFSNLLQRLPRSGEWMVWVKQVFGVILLGLAAFYVALGLAPGLVPWVAPIALLVGGVYLGFVDRSGGQKPAFRRLKMALGALAVVGGAAIVATMPREGLALPAFTDQALDATFRSGKPAMLDFSADWCVPCHELERITFTDSRVREAARAFGVFKVDLTRADSPEARELRKRFGVAGVPTVVFLTPDGREVREARVQGFLPPERFLERMRRVIEEVPRAAR